jgi:hypothetical protein
MSDTGHYLVDLDGTLAIYDGWKGHKHIGDPIPLMVGFVREMLDAGKDVRIFTARASNRDNPREHAETIYAISAWCEKHLGRVLPITNEKTFETICIFDDRAVGVEENTGFLLGKSR